MIATQSKPSRPIPWPLLTGGLAPTDYHTAVCGSTRYGKSEYSLSTIVVPAALSVNRPAIMMFDPPGTMAKKFGIHLAHAGLMPWVIYDTICETSRNPGYAFLVPSDNPDPMQRRAENRERRDECKSVILRMEGKLDDRQNPIIAEGLDAALDLFLNQSTPIPFYWLDGCFDPSTDNHKYLVSHCTDPEVVRTFLYYASLSERDWEYRCGPAERRLKKICSTPAFQRRCIPTFDLATFLNAGGIWMGDGESRGNLSRQDLSMVMGMILLQVIQLARSGRLTRKVMIVIDEAANASLLDLNIARALAEAAKWGLVFVLIIQNPLSFNPPEIRDNIIQNCAKLVFFRQVNSDAARFAARIIGTRQLDPLKVRDIQKIERQLDDGYDTIRTTNVSRQWGKDGSTRGISEGEGTAFRPKKRTVIDEYKTLFALDDQMTLFEKIITNQDVGYFVLSHGSYVSTASEYAPLLREPYSNRNGDPLWFSMTDRISVGQENFRAALEREKSTKAAYRTPVTSGAPRLAASKTGKDKKVPPPPQGFD